MMRNLVEFVCIEGYLYLDFSHCLNQPICGEGDLENERERERERERDRERERERDREREGERK